MKKEEQQGELPKSSSKRGSDMNKLTSEEEKDNDETEEQWMITDTLATR